MASASSVKQYTSCINRLTIEGIFPLLQKQPALVVTWINDHASKSGSIDTQNTYVNAILWHLRSNLPEGLYQSPSISSAITAYTAESKRLQLLRIEKSKKQELPAAKAEQLMTWPDVLALKAQASTTLSAEAYLIYLLYTEMPPLRADFTDLAVFPRDSKKRSGNYVVMSKGKSKLILQEYKTAKKYGRQMFILPDSIKQQIIKVRANSPSELLLNMSANLLGKKVSTIFEMLAGKRMSINLLRHAYIKEFLSKKRTIKEKETLARNMLHSTTLQEQYDLVPEEEEE